MSILPTDPINAPLGTADEAVSRASDSIALLEATMVGIMSCGDGLSPPEARGALNLLELVQADLETIQSCLQTLTQTKRPLSVVAV